MISFKFDFYTFFDDSYLFYWLPETAAVTDSFRATILERPLCNSQAFRLIYVGATADPDYTMATFAGALHGQTSMPSSGHETLRVVFVATVDAGAVDGCVEPTFAARSTT